MKKENNQQEPTNGQDPASDEPLLLNAEFLGGRWGVFDWRGHNGHASDTASPLTFATAAWLALRPRRLPDLLAFLAELGRLAQTRHENEKPQQPGGWLPGEVMMTTMMIHRGGKETRR